MKCQRCCHRRTSQFCCALTTKPRMLDLRRNWLKAFLGRNAAIVNPTSDISEYIKRRARGVACSGKFSRSTGRTLDVVADLPQQRIGEMRRYAKNRARASFDYTNYCSGLRDFLRAASSRTMARAYES